MKTIISILAILALLPLQAVDFTLDWEPPDEHADRVTGYQLLVTQTADVEIIVIDRIETTTETTLTLSNGTYRATITPVFTNQWEMDAETGEQWTTNTVLIGQPSNPVTLVVDPGPMLRVSLKQENGGEWTEIGMEVKLDLGEIRPELLRTLLAEQIRE